ncbi:T9SS type A sorting domain-containing protein [Flavobacterium sp. RSB2_4_14]|uniref:T9SS type A sorting domain-containing protein n=1 Tax=Flavobacterium sp. RSB2_4_14 TaxID=3447665 RepID=UPI003F32A627
MRKLLFILMFVLSVNLQAQLYVSNNSYVFNKNSLVYVTSDVELNGANSNFYLRNEGQLLQGGTTVGGVNKGIGKLSVFQEGTVNNYGYNYWCSPVGNASALVGNEPFGITMLNVPTTLTSSNPAIISSATYDGVSGTGSLTIASYWIWRFLSSSNYSQWVQSAANTDILTGQGFTMKGTSGTDLTNVGETEFNNPGSKQRYDFRGKPNDGTINIPVAAQVTGTQYANNTLTGNPYSSAINLNYFLLENSGYNVNYSTGAVTIGGPVNVINGTAYFWEHVKPANSHVLIQYVGGYGYYVANNSNANSPGTYNSATWNTYNIDGSLNTTGGSSGSNYRRMFSPVGQGFMVQGTANGNAQMKNIYRVFRQEGIDPTISNSQFERINNVSQTNNSQNWEEIPNVAGVDYTQFSKDLVPQIKLHTIINNQFTKEVTIAFNPNAFDGYEQAFDAYYNKDDFANDAFLSIIGVLDPFVISTLPFDIDKRIPFTLKASEQCSFKIKVANIINFNGSDNVYLFDGATGLYHDIINNNFDITLPSGVYNNRFEITFKNSSLSINDDIKSNLIITQNNTNQTVTVHNPNLLELKSAKLYDLTGKLIFDKQRLGFQNSYQFSTSGLADSVYLIEVSTTDNRKMVQKIIVSSN